MNVINKTENKNELLSRNEHSFSVVYEGVTPSKAQIKELVVKEFKADAERIVIKTVKTKFGSTTADCVVFIYTDAEKQAQIEDLTMHKKIREKIEAAKKIADEAAAKAAEEAKAAKEAKEAAKAAEAETPKEEPKAEEAKEE